MVPKQKSKQVELVRAPDTSTSKLNALVNLSTSSTQSVVDMAIVVALLMTAWFKSCNTSVREVQL